MSAKSSSSACPKCGTTLPLTAAEGLCPRCLFAQLATDDAPVDEGAPEAVSPPGGTNARPEFGDYQLLEEIGQGGMGTVYRARQLSLNRPVAIKVIKLGMDTRAVIARFDAERHALALMDHPGIARVFDAGATEAGRPYFVMELVRGTKITEYCDQHNLSARERLELFIKICHAVQHAHQKGIIHRDLKPSNILVTELDGEPVPKVIDFGIAKATESRLTDQTAFTSAGQLVGTPAYLSPEQAEFGGLDIDTRSDIYSLGALLYELLTGHLPFDPSEFARVGLDEVRRIIREQQPVRPSTRLRQTANLKVSPSRFSTLNSQLSTDLDWIVMKCLEKDRSRRYATANGLASDLQRHLNNEPVQARPPSRFYEFQKTMRRHWVGFAAVAAVLVILAIGVLVSTFEAVRARKAEAHERKVAYAAKIGLMQAAWEQNRVTQVRQLLEETASYPDRGFEWYYWQRQAHLELKTLRGHLDGIGGVTFSPDGTRVGTSGADQDVIVWDAVSGSELFALKGHHHAVDTVAFSPDGGRIVTAGRDDTAIIWDTQSGLRIRTLEGHTGRIQDADFSPDGQRVLTASWDGTAKIWDTTNGSLLHTLQGHTGPINDAAFSPDGRRIVTGSDDRTGRVWDAFTGNELFRLVGLSNAVWCVAWSSDGQRIATGGDNSDPTARVWEAATGRQLLVLAGHGSHIKGIRFSPDSRHIATASTDQTARVWDALTGNLLFILRGHAQEVNDVAFSPDGTRIITGSSDRTARIWDARGDRQVLTLQVSSGSLAAAFSRDCRRIVTGSIDKTAEVWDALTGKLLITLQGEHRNEVRSVAFSPDGRRIVTGSTDSTAKVWDAASGQCLFTLAGHRGAVTRVAFSPDGRRIATGSTDKTAMIWESASGKPLLTLAGHTERIIDLVFSADGRRIATASVDQTARVWDATTARELFELEDSDGAVAGVAFSPDGRQLATTCTNGTAKLWDAASRKRLFTFRGHTDLARGVAFSPDGRRILTGSNDRTARLWDTASGEELLALRGHNDNVMSVAFSSDGHRILTSSTDRTAKVWDAVTAEELTRWQAEERNAEVRLAALAREHAAREQHARASSVQDPGAIKQWLFLGPIGFEGHNGASGLAEDQVAGEALLRPRAGQGVQGNDLHWGPVRLPDYIVNFHNFYGADPPWVVAYLACYIQSESDQANLLMRVGSQDQSKVYLNGAEIYRYENPRKYVPDQDVVTNGVALKKGSNVLVFKVVTEEDASHASLRLADAAGRPLKGIRVTLTPP